jgi:hypothetical protein
MRPRKWLAFCGTHSVHDSVRFLQVIQVESNKLMFFFAWPNRHTPYAIAMFDCHLKGNKAQCGKVYTKSRGTLCSGKVKMTDCEHANEPSSEVVVV